MLEIEIHGNIGFIILNRVKALNALSVAMIVKMYNTLQEWQADDAIAAVVIKSKQNTVFCAGGDIKALYAIRDTPIDELMSFFKLEFKLNYLLHTYPKPIITLMNGLVMGGGVGIGMHNCLPIAGENMLCAMPETKIGLFPDVGSSHVLHKLPLAWRNYVGLFGAKLTTPELCAFKLVAAYIPTINWDDFLNCLIDGKQSITAAIDAFKQMPSAPIHQIEEEWRLAAPTFAELMNNIEQARTAEIVKIQQQLTSFSPLSLVVTFEKLQLSQRFNLQECLQQDYQLMYHFMKKSDFFEGVRAMMIDKDKHPHWLYQDWHEVPYALVQTFQEKHCKLFDML